MNPRDKIAVIDTGAGNLFSLSACLNRIGFDAELVTSSKDFKSQGFTALVIPGQGRFGTVMQNLTKSELAEVVKDWYQANKSIIGICVGMQIFFESSEEDEGVAGLRLLSGSVTKLNSPKQPMIGWSSLESSDPLLNNKDVYFVNSFAVKDSSFATSRVTYGEPFVSSIQSKGLLAFQFHPEKSGKVGEEILKQCLLAN